MKAKFYGFERNKLIKVLKITGDINGLVSQSHLTLF